MGDLLSIGTSLYLIPFFQREYRWAPDKAKNLLQDILNVVDGLSDKHFLGAVIVHGRRANPTDPKVFEVIDGQQRLTTAFLFMSALIKVLANKNEQDEAASLAQNYLQIGRDFNKSNLRIHSSRLDRSMMSAVIEDLKADEKFMEALKPYSLNPLPSYGSNRGALRNNYNRFKRFFSDEYDQGGMDRIREIYGAFLNDFTVVQIDVLDPTDGPKIFDSLNSKQEPMRISDLVRNEIFRKISNEPPEKIERIDEEVWQPFFASFEFEGANCFERFLFPFALIFDPNLKKSEVFFFLRNEWNKVDDPSEIISNFEEYRRPFLDTLFGRNECNFPAELAERFSRFSRLGAPSSILPFTMQLGKAVLDETVSEDTAIEILEVVEAFLVRRALAGHEPTGLHAVFKRLWVDLGDQITSISVRTAISDHKTVVWPDAEEVKRSVETRPLYGSAITSYFLLEYDSSLGGDRLQSIETAEHVLPQKPDSEWKQKFGEKNIQNNLDALANLLPCTGKMNASMGNQPYSKKRVRFEKDSKFKSAREFAYHYEEWNFENFSKRARIMAEWAIDRWPHEKTKS